MPQHIEVTAQQRATLEKVKREFAENGYYIYPVAPFFRRNEHDFVAAQKDWPRQFLVVRPTPKGFVSVIPFALRTLYHKPRKIISSLQKKSPKTIRWSGKQLRFARQRPDWWKDYFPPEASEMLSIA